MENYRFTVHASPMALGYLNVFAVVGAAERLHTFLKQHGIPTSDMSDSHFLTLGLNRKRYLFRMFLAKLSQEKLSEAVSLSGAVTA
jgi:hypothetical protein